MINLKNLPNQQRGEVTKLFLRRHWLIVAEILGYLLTLVVIPFISMKFLTFAEIDPLSDIFWGPVTYLLFSVYLLFVLVIIITQFTDYYLDTWIVTTERIINIEQRGLFTRTISELHLNQIQDVTAERKGILSMFLNFGQVYIQTAGAKERFNFKQIHNPEGVKQVITGLINDDKRRHGDASGQSSDQNHSETTL
ncbi:MAG: PH domain-containing protein [Candidatus Uhrbacteria bacterium]|nr:PH domain-containing protein [Candidatus Uhrbacteria bacterium]